MEHQILTANNMIVDVHIENVQDGHYASTTEADIVTQYIIKGFAANYQAKRIRVDFAMINKRASGEILGSDRGFYEITDPLEFSYFYDVPAFESLGISLAKHCLNGLLFRKFGVRCFSLEGTFYQPVTFELDVFETDISVIPMDGIAPFKYSLDGAGYANDPVFAGLGYGIHTMYVIDNVGTISSKQVELIEIIEQA